MAYQWPYIDQEWCSWWDTAWQPPCAGFQHLAPTARHSLSIGHQQLNSPGISRRRPLRTRLCRCSVAGHTQLSPGCFYTDSQLGSSRLDSVCPDPQLSSRRFHAVILDHPASLPHLFDEALQDPGPTPGHSPLTCQCWPVGRAPSFAFLTFCGSSCLPAPPDQKVSATPPPFDLIPSKAKPPRSPQTQDASTALAGTPFASHLASSREQNAGTAPAGTQHASAPHAGRQAPVRNADRTGYEPFPKPAAHVLPMWRLCRIHWHSPPQTVSDERTQTCHLRQNGYGLHFVPP